MRIVSIVNDDVSKNLVGWSDTSAQLFLRLTTHPRPMQALGPTENGINASLFHSPKNLSGLKVNGSSQYRAVRLFVNNLSRFAEEGNSYGCSEVR